MLRSQPLLCSGAKLIVSANANIAAGGAAVSVGVIGLAGLDTTAAPSASARGEKHVTTDPEFTRRTVAPTSIESSVFAAVKTEPPQPSGPTPRHLLVLYRPFEFGSHLCSAHPYIVVPGGIGG
eukprot:SAG31_NODE_4386_length_3279_cov_1.891824_1_plen_123_part_00